jgi:Zn ribbon nucleic-acid-binding protein
LGADPKSKIHYPSHQRVLVECVKCGYKTSVVGYSLLQGLSKQCKGCVNRKYQVGHGVTDGRKENLNSKVLNQT